MANRNTRTDAYTGFKLKAMETSPSTDQLKFRYAISHGNGKTTLEESLQLNLNPSYSPALVEAKIELKVSSDNLGKKKGEPGDLADFNAVLDKLADNLERMSVALRRRKTGHMLPIGWKT